MGGLPPLQARWLAELLPGPIADETVATCSSCVMLPIEGEKAIAHFSVETKCCTYLPKVPNFLVGKALQAGGVSQVTMTERIARRSAVTPLGVGRTRTYDVVYERGAERAFGRARTLRCPHYQADLGGACGIWQSRNAVCATWFCKHVRGEVGSAFWAAMRDLLNQVETALATWCLLELRVSPALLTQLLAIRRQPTGAHDGADVDMTEDPNHAKNWGDLVGHELEHFTRCADLVEPLAWADVERIAGTRLHAAREILLDAYRRVTDDRVPTRARAGSYRAIESNREVVKLTTYSEYDPLELPRILHDVLPEFDGRPVDEVLDGLADSHGVALEPGLIRRLADFGVLVAED